MIHVWLASTVANERMRCDRTVSDRRRRKQYTMGARWLRARTDREAAITPRAKTRPEQTRARKRGFLKLMM